MNETLKPCPFCGGKAEAVKPSSYTFNVGCQNCGCVLFTNHTQFSKAAREWNNRNPSPDELYALIKLFAECQPHEFSELRIKARNLLEAVK